MKIQFSNKNLFIFKMILHELYKFTVKPFCPISDNLLSVNRMKT